MPIPQKGSRWGILGGRFDPVHFGHLTLASEAKRLQNLDGVLLVLSRSHPIKQTQAGASFDDRVAMLRLAVAPYDFMEISTIEMDRDLSGYTLDTVKALKSEYPGCEFFFIVGADNLTQLEQWYQPEAIVAEVTLIAGARPGYDLPKLDWLAPERIIRMESALVDVSSSQVRDLLVSAPNDPALADLIPAEVIEYIKQRSLYR